MAWADIKHLPHPETHEEMGVEKERGKDWEEVSREQDVIMTVWVCDSNPKGDIRKTNMKEQIQRRIGKLSFFYHS